MKLTFRGYPLCPTQVLVSHSMDSLHLHAHRIIFNDFPSFWTLSLSDVLLTFDSSDLEFVVTYAKSAGHVVFCDQNILVKGAQRAKVTLLAGVSCIPRSFFSTKLVDCRYWMLEFYSPQTFCHVRFDFCPQRVIEFHIFLPVSRTHFYTLVYQANISPWFCTRVNLIYFQSSILYKKPNYMSDFRSETIKCLN